jgi:uncharacterized membrane protein HdeD (DUF308 family)
MREESKTLPQLSGVKRSFIRCHSTRKRIDMQQLIGNFRTMFLFRGIAAVLFGVLTLVWPKLSLTALVLVFGVFAVISGITAVVAALRSTDVPGWGLLLLQGILGTLAGAIALVLPGITALAFLYLLAAWAIITGILEVIAPLSFPMSTGRGVLMALAGVLSVVFGILIAAQPAAGLLAVVWLIGIYAIVFGIMYIVVYFESRSLAASIA